MTSVDFCVGPLVSGDLLVLQLITENEHICYWSKNTYAGEAFSVVQDEL
jgi:hypothetical protein